MSEDPYAALKLANFRLLLAGRLFINLAFQIQGIAVGWQIYALTKSPLALGMIGLAEALPAIGIALYAGHIADVVDRRVIIRSVIVTSILALGLLGVSSSASLGVAILIPCIFALVGLSGFARGFYGPAVFGMLGDIVPRGLYGNAVAWNTVTWQASAVAGPVLGGIVYVWLGAASTYCFTTLLLAISLLVFVLIKSNAAPMPEKKETSVSENIKEGVRFVFSNQVILGAMALDLFAVLFGGAVALLPIFTAEIFHKGPEALGILRAAPSMGSVIVAGVLTHRPLLRHTGAIFLASVAGFGFCMIGFGLSTSFYVSLALLAISGALDGVSVYVRTTIIQLLTPPEMKGRVAAVNSIFIGSSNEIGAFESGVAAKLMGVVPSVVFGGCMTLLVVAITAMKAPKLRQLHMHHLNLVKSETT
jgi:MFS family permease